MQEEGALSISHNPHAQSECINFDVFHVTPAKKSVCSSTRGSHRTHCINGDAHVVVVYNKDQRKGSRHKKDAAGQRVAGYHAEKRLVSDLYTQLAQESQKRAVLAASHTDLEIRNAALESQLQAPGGQTWKAMYEELLAQHRQLLDDHAQDQRTLACAEAMYDHWQQMCRCSFPPPGPPLRGGRASHGLSMLLS